MQTVVLDACALMAYIHREKGYNLVARHFHESHVALVMHAVNFYEVYYKTLRNQPASAQLLFELVRHTGIQIDPNMDHRLINESANFKIHYKMSLADSIALGLATKLNATLLTADRHEFGAVAEAKVAKIKFIR